MSTTVQSPAKSWRDLAPSVKRLATRGRNWPRLLYVADLVRALWDPATFDLRRNPGLWLGFALALPVPILAFVSSSPPWIDLVALSAPFAGAAIVGAAGRLARLRNHEAHVSASRASRARRLFEADRVLLRGQADAEHARRMGAEITQDRNDVEMAVAQRVNRTLLPPDMIGSDVEVVVRQIPCSFVGGDYLHVARPRRDLLYLCVGDVAGHGVSAALVVSRIHGLVQRLVDAQCSPQEILEKMNRAVTAILEYTALFMTFAVVRVDLTARRIDYATAGHPAQVLLRADGTTVSLSTDNGALGVNSAGAFSETRQASLPHGSGDTLILFTDGLFEVAARNGGEMLGEEGLFAGLGSLAGREPADIATVLLHRAVDFGRAGPFADDVSLIVARLGPRLQPAIPSQRVPPSLRREDRRVEGPA